LNQSMETLLAEYRETAKHLRMSRDLAALELRRGSSARSDAARRVRLLGEMLVDVICTIHEIEDYLDIRRPYGWR